MNFGTKGCMYNCGDSCTGECMKPTNDGISEEKMNKDTLYSEIEYLIIMWSNNGTKTAGSLTRDIMKLL